MCVHVLLVSKTMAFFRDISAVLAVLLIHCTGCTGEFHTGTCIGS